jgi:hypothetical protein
MSMRRDLFRRIRDRHFDWARDSASLYEMGELSSRHAAEDIITVVADFLANGILALEINEAQFFETLHKMIERRRNRRSEAEDEL